MSTKKPRAAKRTAPKNQPKAAGFCVYIGPTILGVIQTGMVLRGTKEEAVETVALAVEKYPLVKTLIVPGETLGVDRIKVNTPGNLLYVNYHKLVAGRK